MRKLPKGVLNKCTIAITLLHKDDSTLYELSHHVPSHIEAKLIWNRKTHKWMPFYVTNDIVENPDGSKEFRLTARPMPGRIMTQMNKAKIEHATVAEFKYAGERT